MSEKSKNNKFSYKYFSQKADLKSTGFFSDIISGRRNLTQTVILKLGNILKLKKEETEYFETLVYFNQAKTVEEKNYYYNRIIKFKKIKREIINRNQYNFFSKWYYPVIRELINFIDFKGDYIALARKLNPPIRPDQAKIAVQTLEELEFIRKNKDGCYVQTANLLSTGDTLSELNIANFQTNMIELAKSSINRFPKEERDISTVTLTMSTESFKRAKGEIAALRKKLLLDAEQEKKVDKIIQVNFQMFPLTNLNR